MFKSLICLLKGHDLHDVITLIGEHGHLDLTCKRCGKITFDMDVSRKDVEGFLNRNNKIS